METPIIERRMRRKGRAAEILIAFTVGAGVLCLLAMLFFSGPKMACAATVAKVPANAPQYLPMLVAQQKAVWPTMAVMPGWTGAQVQKESCISVTHSKCWNPRAELKTAREYGFGFGQTTIAYNKDGTERFNVFKEMQDTDAVLRTWRWEDRYNPSMQLRALLLKNKIGYDHIVGAKNETERLAFSLAAYNGGMGGVLSDRRMCQGMRYCDQSRWFGHVELTSNKSKIPNPGYGQSAFQINRAYPQDIMYTLRPAYIPYFQ